MTDEKYPLGKLFWDCLQEQTQPLYPTGCTPDQLWEDLAGFREGNYHAAWQRAAEEFLTRLGHLPKEEG